MKEQVLNILNNKYDALDIMTLNDLLKLTTVEELEELTSSINELVNELVIYQTKKNKYILYDNCPNFRKGILDVKDNSYGFLLLDDEKDIHISKENLNYALDGDTVLVEIIKNDINKPEGKVLKVLKRDIKNVVGTIKNDNGFIYFDPLKKKNINIKIDRKELNKCVDGEIIVVKLVDDLGKNKYQGKILLHIGHKDDPFMDVKIIAANHDIFFDFREETIEELNAIPTEVLDRDYIGRKDLTDKVIFTIDGINTKDIDDAISLEKDGDNYLLGVHIADVSYYVKEGSNLDQEAYERATSNYLANSVIPMLPHKLSNGICSLNPNTLRCSLSTIMKIDNKGNIINVDFFPSIIKSRMKMNYTSVNHLLVDNIIDEGYLEYKDNLLLMEELSNILIKKRINDGYIDFEIPEPVIITDENGKCIDIARSSRGPGEMLIESFMIANNEAISEYMSNMDLPFVYRVHDVPNQEKLQKFINICNMLGNQIKGKYDKIKPKDYQQLLASLNDKTDVLKNLALRSMAKAKYSSNNIGHFGLGLKYYSHWTSPIRRYPDLLAHRLVRKFIFDNNMDIKTINYYEKNLEVMCDHCSLREVNAIDAERDVNKMKMAEYMQDHIGEVYKGIISGVVKTGIFVQLDNLVEGKIPITSFGNLQFNFIEEFQCLKGINTNKEYKLGDELLVKCVRSSKELSQIDFEIVEESNGDK